MTAEERATMKKSLLYAIVTILVWSTMAPVVKTLLTEKYTGEGYGFPVVREQTEKLLDEDMAAVSFRLDEKGEFELDKKGEKIEIPRSTWYSGEWRQHYVYALTEAQKDRLLKLIDSAV